ncbi:hypothetical protein L1887_54198 [Cichorium endivia]|nr:hypothetical protein L1887_54198 [Cichorium endivia]
MRRTMSKEDGMEKLRAIEAGPSVNSIRGPTSSASQGGEKGPAGANKNRNSRMNERAAAAAASPRTQRAWEVKVRVVHEVGRRREQKSVMLLRSSSRPRASRPGAASSQDVETACRACQL